MHAVAAAYPQSTLNSTATYSSLSGTASYETYVAGQGESGCVHIPAYGKRSTEMSHICDPTPANEALCGKIVLSYEQKCKVKSKFF